MDDWLQDQYRRRDQRDRIETFAILMFAAALVCFLIWAFFPALAHADMVNCYWVGQFQYCTIITDDHRTIVCVTQVVGGQSYTTCT